MLGLKRPTFHLFAALLATSVATLGCDGAPTNTPDKPAPKSTTTTPAAPAKPEAAPAPAPAPAPADSAAVPPPQDDVILIGHYASMTGSEATFGESTDNGI